MRGKITNVINIVVRADRFIPGDDDLFVDFSGRLEGVAAVTDDVVVT